ncbi:MAG: HD domain-containing protein, partial [Bacillota bacterium]|nr:HD domain-containing protein [Bacillota bacterium]
MLVENAVIGNFREGFTIQGYYIIKEVELKKSKNNSKYLDLILADKTGEVNSKIWDYKLEESEFSKNALVKVRGEVINYSNNLQLNISKMRTANEEDNVKIEDFVPAAPIPAEDMLNTIESYISRIENKDIKNIVSYIIDEYRDKLMFYPAAMKNHHSIKGGLLYHVSTMLVLGEKISQVYPFLNTDLLYAGIILHDISKIDEMDSSDLGIVEDYTVEGKMLGHIIQGIKKLEMVGEKLKADKEIVLLLQHMVLTHHYEPEYGSPKKPMLKEAEILHYIDKIDATMFDIGKAL